MIIDRLNIYIEEGKKKKRKEGKILRSAKVISAVIFFDGLLRAKQKIYTRKKLRRKT